MNKKYHILVINHRYGTDSHVFSTRKKANQYLYSYVVNWWCADGPKRAMPKSKIDAVEQYFDHVANNVESEWYRIDSSVLDPEYA